MVATFSEYAVLGHSLVASYSGLNFVSFGSFRKFGTVFPL